MNLTHIESRKSKDERGCFQFYVIVDDKESSPKDISALLEDLKKISKNVTLHHEEGEHMNKYQFMVFIRVHHEVFYAIHYIVCSGNA